mgnify:CR=1 FL=1
MSEHSKRCQRLQDNLNPGGTWGTEGTGGETGEGTRERNQGKKLGKETRAKNRGINRGKKPGKEPGKETGRAGALTSRGSLNVEGEL